MKKTDMKRLVNISSHEGEGIALNSLFRYNKLRKSLDIPSTKEYYFAATETVDNVFSSEIEEDVLVAPGYHVERAHTITPAVVLGSYNVSCGDQYLKNMPVYIGGSCSVVGSPNLVDFRGITQYCGRNYFIFNCAITSFKGLPEVIEGDLSVQMCSKIDNLDYFPREVKGKILISQCPLFTYKRADIAKICKCSNIQARYNGD